MARFLPILAVLAVLVSCTNAQAIVLDWDTATWANGSLSNSYDIDLSVAGNDITVTVSGNTTQLAGSSVTGTPPTPAITVGLEGGLSPVQKSLEIAVDLTNQSQQITTTVSFSALYTQGVNNVSFTIFDVDFVSNPGNNSSNFQDQLRSIVGLSTDGVTQIAPTITFGSANTLSGTGLNQMITGTATSSDTGAGSGNGNVTISFGTNAIKSFSFVYGSGSGTIADPTYQHIGIADISFTPVPEINPAWTAFGSCSFAVFGALLHRRKVHRAQIRADDALL